MHLGLVQSKQSPYPRVPLYIFHYALFLNGLKKFIVVYDLLAEKYLDCICSVMCTWPLVVYDLLAGNSESGLQSDTSRLMALKPQSILCNCNSNIGISRAPLKNQVHQLIHEHCHYTSLAGFQSDSSHFVAFKPWKILSNTCRLLTGHFITTI